MPVDHRLVLVTGATGAVGPSVVRAFIQEGLRIRTLSIEEAAPDVFPLPIEVIQGDVTSRRDVESAMRGVDAVVHMAALLHHVNPAAGMRADYDRVNVGGTATVVEAARNAGVKRLVYFSTISVYGASDGRTLDENSPARPVTFYGQTKLAAERIVVEARNAEGRPLGTVLRLATVYGPRVKGNYEKLVRALARRRFIPVGRGTNRRTLVNEKDVGRATVLAASHLGAAGKTFNVTDGRIHALREIIESICAALGRRPPRLRLPAGPVRAVAGLMERGIHLIGGKAPLPSALVLKYTEDIAVEGRLIQQELGFRPLVDLRSGWTEAIKEWRA